MMISGMQAGSIGDAKQMIKSTSNKLNVKRQVKARTREQLNCFGKGKLEKIKEISNISKFCPKQFNFVAIKLDQIDNRESFDSIHIQTKNNKVTSLLYRHEIQGKPKIQIIFIHICNLNTVILNTLYLSL
jgi:hypothetical protein